MDNLTHDLSQCTACPLRSKARAPVPGRGPTDSPIMFVGEAPGRHEDEQGKPFVGPAGRELAHYMQRHGWEMDDFYITNTVKCWPGEGDPDPTTEQIRECSNRWLWREIDILCPQVVVAMGASAIEVFLGRRRVEDVHGVPVPELDWLTGFSSILLPTYHPAAGMYQTSIIAHLMRDFDVLRELMEGADPGNYQVEDAHPNTSYSMDWGLMPPSSGEIFAIDTETVGGELWCASVAFNPGSGHVLYRDILGDYQFLFDDPSLRLICHNAAFDLDVLHRAGITIKGQIDDTMIMASLLQTEARGLKFLAGRLCGMQMQDYKDVVTPQQQQLAVAYLTRVVGQTDWPNPTPVEEAVWSKKDNALRIRLKKPQHILRKAKRILADTIDGKADAWDRWRGIPQMERMEVEEELGPMPEASVADVPESEAIYYAARDADATLRVYNVLHKRLVDKGMEKVYRDLDMPAVMVTSAMMRAGFPVDRNALFALRTEFQQQLHTTEIEAWSQAGYLFNPASSLQVADLLFNRLGLTPGRRTPTGRISTDDDELVKYRKVAPVIAPILEYRHIQKMLTAFIAPLLARSEEDGRIHCDLRSTGTETGRMTASNPNLQQVPTRTEEGKRIRDCFMARPGFTLLSADLSQIELRVTADLSQDQALLDAFRAGRDIHSETAAAMFHIPLDQVHPEKHRFPAKGVSFGTIYGMSAEGLLYRLETEVPDGGWTLSACRDMLQDYFKAHPGVKVYIQEQHAFARRYGYVIDMFGRRRDIPEVYAARKKTVVEGLRKAVNTPIQSTAAGIIKVHMREISAYIQAMDWQEVVIPLLQIHDDLLFEVREDILPQAAGMVMSIMAEAVTLDVPVLAEAKVGAKWGSMEKWK